MLDREQKRRLYNSTRRNIYLTHFVLGLKATARSLGKMIVIGALIVFYIISLANESNAEPQKMEMIKDATDYFYVFYSLAVTLTFLPLIFITIVMFGLPRGAKQYNDDFQRIGMSNDAGEAPALISRKRDAGNPRMQILEFKSKGFPLAYWQDHKDEIESGHNITIDRIERGKNNQTILVYAVDGSYQLPERIDWSPAYVSIEGFTLVFGESVASRVEVDLAKVPHVLLGGSTGSGKTQLLKLLLMQCVLKGAKVYIADFKGGVDFNRSWRFRATIVTEPDELLKCLEALVGELHRRKRLFAEKDCANIDEYNRTYIQNLPRYVFACDEVAELLDKTGLDKQAKERIAKFEAALSTLVRLGRAFGIHCILATQRPDATIISGQIKNNIDFRVCGRADDVLSQIVLDKTDANDLISKTAQGRFLTNTDVLFQAYYFEDKKDW